ncbi:integrase arm-type DNA-binding domain-containing protein [Roseomonas sp. GC11]|uniref:tyrosine-type recombinase/integrase n=1 Tax=Roseomonas sp. GC11 TaxID=2950546 RepID=UPI00210A2182|nr:integrase arm-type DNA-binding domain-containing protein [Roseomonas sp. GC11]MCQ4161275.1 integrase arm-type DNA-binding domain-containing protein [Roseomonas sp. GC11]
MGLNDRDSNSQDRDSNAPAGEARASSRRRPLTPLDIRHAAPRAKKYRLQDGNGLALAVYPSGAKVWELRTVIHGKRSDMGLGGWPAVSLKDAREKARDLRARARADGNPIQERRDQRQAALAEQRARIEAEGRTFRAVAELYIRKEAPGWKNDRTAQLWRSSLELHAFPLLGSRPVAEIGREDVLRVLEPLWTDKPSVGKKVLERLGSILRYATVRGWRSGDNPADRRMLRTMGLSAQPGSRKQASLPWAQLPAFCQMLDHREGIAPLALRFLILTCLRSSEARGVRWSDLSFEGSPTLTIAGERMKGEASAPVASHRLPLSAAALATLARAYTQRTGVAAGAADVPRLARLMGDTLIFPNAKGTAPLSDMALSAVMKRMNEDRPEGAPSPWRDPDGREAVPHGFRGSFRTWVDDTRPADSSAAEKALAHRDDSTVEGRYRRSDMFDRRIPLMEAWGAWCAGEAQPQRGTMPAGSARA